MPPDAKITTPKGSVGYKAHLATYITTVKEPRLSDIIASFQKTTTELKEARLLRMLSRSNLFNSIRVGYMGIMWRNLSIDLVAASLRTRICDENHK